MARSCWIASRRGSLTTPSRFLMALTKLVVLLDLDVERRTAGEALVARPAVEVEPQVARLYVRAILASGTTQSEDGCREAVEPATKKLDAG